MAEFDSVIPAGRSGKLVAKIHTKPSFNGKMAKTINVQTSAAGSETIRLEIVANVSAPIIISPKYQIHINGMVGENASERILLHRRDGKKLELEPVEAPPAGLTYKLIEVKEADASVRGIDARPGDVWLEVATESSTVAGNAALRAVFKTNQPEMPEVTIPVTMRIRELIEARPSQVRLWLTDQPTQNGGMTVRLSHNRAEPFEIGEVKPSRPELFSVAIATSGAQKMHTLRVELAPEIDVASLLPQEQGEIVVKTSDPGAPAITLPVMVMKRDQPQEKRRDAPPVRNPARQIPGTLALPTGTPGTR